MEVISVFDMFKIGVGPSSSHTMGPWRAAQRFLANFEQVAPLERIARLTVELFGSLAKTGKGHGTDLAVMMGLSGVDPVTCETATLGDRMAAIHARKELLLDGRATIPFDPARDLLIHRDQTLPFHPNGMRFTAELTPSGHYAETWFSIGGGFVVQETPTVQTTTTAAPPFPSDTAAALLGHCLHQHIAISEIVRRNEQTWRTDAEINAGLDRLWETMRDCIFRGCQTEGVLPGGLNVVRRAPRLYQKLFTGLSTAVPDQNWIHSLGNHPEAFADVLKWVCCFALAVNEENAAFGRVVTAPTNGAAGVVPAVLMYFAAFHQADAARIRRFLLTASEIGALFKRRATISAAMGGCQAEIGVSSAMAAAGLCEGLDGTPEQALMAAEIAMEHHLGMTCDPVAGLVQIPCIERNTMGAIKAITAANLALESDPARAKVTLDAVIQSMWETALDMNTKYKETSEGGLALQIPVSLSEC